MIRVLFVDVLAALAGLVVGGMIVEYVDRRFGRGRGGGISFWSEFELTEHTTEQELSTTPPLIMSCLAAFSSKGISKRESVTKSP